MLYIVTRRYVWSDLQQSTVRDVSALYEMAKRKSAIEVSIVLYSSVNFSEVVDEIGDSKGFHRGPMLASRWQSRPTS